jgi:hypothetical protein
MDEGRSSRVLAGLLLLGSLGALVFLLLHRGGSPSSMLLMIGPSLLVGFTSIYVLAGRNHRLYDVCRSDSSDDCRTRYLVSILLFWFFIVIELYVCGITKGAYSRPVLFFVVASLAAAVLAYGITLNCLKPSRGWTVVFLLEIIVLGAVLRTSPQILFPDVTGIDPWWNAAITSEIAETGELPEDTGYTLLPVAHGILSAIMIVSGIEIIPDFIVSGMVIAAAGSLALFSVGKRLLSPRIGLLSALLFSFSDILVQIGVWIRPISYGTLMFLCLLMAFVLYARHRTVRYEIVLLAFGFAVVLSHVVVTLFAALFLMGALFFIVLMSIAFEKGGSTRLGKPIISPSVIISFIVVLVAWWLFASGSLDQLERLADFGLSYAKWETSSESDQYVSQVLLQRMVGVLGFNLLVGVACLGIIDSLRMKRRTPLVAALLLSALVMIGVLFGAIAIDASGLLAARWYPTTEGLACIPAAYAIVWIGAVCGFRLRRFVIPSVVFLMALLMMTAPSANFDSPYLTPDVTPRMALKSSEIVAAQDSSSMVGDYYEICTDYYYWRFYSQFGPMNGLLPTGLGSDISPALVNGSIDEIGGIMAIRTEILDHPFYYFGTVKASETLPAVLNSENYSCVYDIGTVKWYVGTTLADV